MTEADKILKSVKTNVRSVLMPNPQGLILDSLVIEYENLLFEKIPHVKLGYGNVLELLSSMPDTVEIFDMDNGKILLKAVPDKKTAHVQKMVAEQNVSSTGYNKKTQEVLKEKSNIRSLRKQIHLGQTKTRLPSTEIQKNVATLLKERLEGYPLPDFSEAYHDRFGALEVGAFGFEDVRDMLFSLTTIADMRQVGEKWLVVPSFDLRQEVEAAAKDKRRTSVPPLKKSSLAGGGGGVSDGGGGRDARAGATLGASSRVNTNSGTGGGGNRQRRDHKQQVATAAAGQQSSQPPPSVQSSAKEKQKRNGAAPPAPSPEQRTTFETDDLDGDKIDEEEANEVYVPQIVRHNMKELLSACPSGIVVNEFAKLYRARFWSELDPRSYTCASLIELAFAVPSVFRVEQRPGSGRRADWLLFGATGGDAAPDAALTTAVGPATEHTTNSANSGSRVNKTTSGKPSQAARERKGECKPTTASPSPSPSPPPPLDAPRDSPPPPIVPTSILVNVKRLCLKHKESGILLVSFQSMFRAEFPRIPFDITSLGFTTTSDFLISLAPDVLSIQYKNGSQLFAFPPPGVASEWKSEIEQYDEEEREAALAAGGGHEVLGADHVIPQAQVPADLTVDSYLGVVVGEVFHPGYFYVQIVPEGRTKCDQLDKLMDELGDFYGEHKDDPFLALPAADIVKGLPVAAFYSGEGWHRAVVTDVHENPESSSGDRVEDYAASVRAVKVNYIDYGSQQRYSSSIPDRLRRLVRGFGGGRLPAQAIRARLAGLAPAAHERGGGGGGGAEVKDGRWSTRASTRASKRLLQLVGGQRMFAGVKGFQRGYEGSESRLSLWLVDTDSNDDPGGIDINQILIDEGLAKPDPNAIRNDSFMPPPPPPTTAKVKAATADAAADKFVASPSKSGARSASPPPTEPAPLPPLRMPAGRQPAAPEDDGGSAKGPFGPQTTTATAGLINDLHADRPDGWFPFQLDGGMLSAALSTPPWYVNVVGPDVSAAIADNLTLLGLETSRPSNGVGGDGGATAPLRQTAGKSSLPSRSDSSHYPASSDVVHGSSGGGGGVAPSAPVDANNEQSSASSVSYVTAAPTLGAAAAAAEDSQRPTFTGIFLPNGQKLHLIEWRGSSYATSVDISMLFPSWNNRDLLAKMLCLKRLTDKFKMLKVTRQEYPEFFEEGLLVGLAGIECDSAAAASGGGGGGGGGGDDGAAEGLAEEVKLYRFQDIGMLVEMFLAGVGYEAEIKNRVKEALCQSISELELDVSV